MLQRKEKTNFNPIIFCLLMPIALLILISIVTIRTKFGYILESPLLQCFSTIFISIILEALPFIIIGVFISSLIQNFISEDTIEKLIPKNKYIGVVVAASLGIFFPICDCAIVPVVRRLLKKGLPMPIGIAFMLSVPIINPVVLASTYYAFPDAPYIVLLRGSLGWISAITIALILDKLEINNTKKVHSLCNRLIYSNDNHIHTHIHSHNSTHNESECACTHHHHHHSNNKQSSLYSIFEHTNDELMEVGKYIIIGAFLSSLMQTFLPEKYILSIGKGNVSSILVMMALAYMLCVCSETDAFIARTFVGRFTSGSIIAFLIFGPMIDIKNTLMLGQAFKHKFIFKLIFTIILVCFSVGATVNLLKISL
jgi:uncharacterized membrane protein YraQ (UPF0718 family)